MKLLRIWPMVFVILLIGCNLSVFLPGGNFPDPPKFDAAKGETLPDEPSIPDEPRITNEPVAEAGPEPTPEETIPEESPEYIIVTDKPVVLTPDKLLLRLKLDEPVNALTTDGRYIYYVTEDGRVYRLDPTKNRSQLMFSTGLTRSTSITLLNNEFFIGDLNEGIINVYTFPKGKFLRKLYETPFPDGMGHWKGHIYAVEEDNKNTLLKIDPKTGKLLGKVETSVPDPVAICGFKEHIFVVEESGDIYRVEPATGNSQVVFQNPFKQDENENMGFEGMVILNGIVWVARIDDQTIYTIRGILK